VSPTRSIRALLLGAALALPAGGCAATAPPDWAWFDVVLHPGGGIPASLGYHAGASIWTPVGLLTGGLLPPPADEFVATGPGHWIGTGVGLVVGAPFHLVALPFGTAGPPPDPPPPAKEPGPAEGKGRTGEAPPAGGR
jgi:hypothetical protein